MITGVFCESQVGEGKALAMVAEESYEVGAVVEIQHRALGVPSRLFYLRVVKRGLPVLSILSGHRRHHLGTTFLVDRVGECALRHYGI
jgi:hypothetical protein